MVLSLSDVALLKKAVGDKFSVKIHFCDSCGGQSFTAENLTEEVKAYISDFFSDKNIKPVFSEKGNSFTFKKI